MICLTALKSLYALNGVIAVLLYLPQISRAWKDRSHALSLSLVTFGGWCLGSLITALYTYRDPLRALRSVARLHLV
ncbi:hypothetical protein GEOBRER4_n2650 [Citrifermentans bremense]|uniref:Uncharacterized protein n=1 Tax=Citrifermentans bremense TaxID=60035 RepID=A0A6S6M8I6_9BACT|nr:PQ-loop domain-containing transporter [Citrifermentans bremense]BCG47801.1 hypothetical protein GEOBRER4_n2650 [Citrifermentans bremense]